MVELWDIMGQSRMCVCVLSVCVNCLVVSLLYVSYILCVR
jgi:hypothetical protein